MKFFKKTSSIIDLLSEFLFLTGGIIIVGVMLLITVATISRYFFGQAIAWATEVAGYSLLLVTFFGGPLLAIKNNHINVDIIPNILGDRGERIMIILSGLASSLVSGLIGYFALNATIEAYISQQMIVSFMRTPKYLLLGVIAGGFILMGLGFLKVAIRNITLLRNKE